MRPILTWVATALPFALLDAIWLFTMATLVYRPTIGVAMRAKPDLLPAVLFYAVYTTALAFFAVARATSVLDALFLGALFGLAAYATYDLSNQATLLFWTWRLAIIDIAWGTFASAAAACIAAAMLSYLPVQQVNLPRIP